MSSPDIEKMSYSQKKRSRWNARSIAIVLLSIMLLYRLSLLFFAAAPQHKQLLSVNSDRGYTDMYRHSWRSLMDALADARPRTATVGKLEPIPGISVESVDKPTSVDILQVDSRDIKAVQDSHEKFMTRLRDGNKLSVIYQSNQEGIVVTATANDLPIVLIQLRLLRRTRSTLPVEVFLLSQDDYDEKICRETFPRLDAHCAILEEYMDSAPLPRMPHSRRERKINGNEPLHKFLALFFTKFENVLVLDPSTLVYNNPDIMFKEEPYLSTGMLLWPDFWASTVSPKLFTVQQAPMEKPNRRDNIRTVDMGQLLVSKSQHGATILLSIYYTYFGPNIYEHLLTQSSAGEQGSQAIKSAARLLEAPYYMMKRLVEAVGYPDLDKPNKEFRGLAMLQSLASDDFHRLPKDRHRPLFIRANNPYLHPAHLMDQGVTVFKAYPSSRNVQINAPVDMANPASSTGMTKVKVSKPLNTAANGLGKSSFAHPPADEGMHHRMWEWFGGRYVSNGWRDPDPERALWEEIHNVACHDYQDFRVWPISDKKRAEHVCQRIKHHRELMGWGDFFLL